MGQRIMPGAVNALSIDHHNIKISQCETIPYPSMIQKINNPRGDIQSLYHDESLPSRIGRCIFGYYHVVTKVTYIRCIVFCGKSSKRHTALICYGILLHFSQSFNLQLLLCIVCLFFFILHCTCNDDIKRKTKMSFLFCISNFR